MKGSFSIAVIALVVVTVSGAVDKQKIISDCKIAHKISDTDKLENYQDDNVKCYYHCVNKKLGKMDANGKMSVEKMLAHYHSTYPDFGDKKTNIIKKCAALANEKTGCDVAATHMKCVREKFTEVKNSQTTQTS